MTREHERHLATLAAECRRLQAETQVTREALNALTTATAMLDLGSEDGDERAVVRNVLVGIERLQAENERLRAAVLPGGPP